MAHTWLWIGFGVVVTTLVILDLVVFHRNTHAVSTREAAIWSSVWITLGLSFTAVVYFWWAPEAALPYLTGYLIELSLSVDNLFVFLMVFTFFKVPKEYQHGVLFWGILGAVIMRGIFIFIGSSLIERFDWILYLFGIFLVFTGIRMGMDRGEEKDPESNAILRLARKYLPITENYEGDHFVVRREGKRFFTPLFLVLLVIESSDLMFALDSIPAIFAITQEPFIIYTSNIFAILGLRSIYFLLARVMDLFRYLKVGLAVILSFVGVKMLIIDWVHVPAPVSLGFIFTVLMASILASWLIKPESRSTSNEGEA